LTRIAFPPEVLSDLGLQRGLEQQLRAEAGDVLHRPSQVAATSEQLIDLDS